MWQGGRYASKSNSGAVGSWRQKGNRTMKIAIKEYPPTLTNLPSWDVVTIEVGVTATTEKGNVATGKGRYNFDAKN